MTFGEFLLHRNAVQPEDLLRCVDYRRWLVPFIGTLAVNRGYMGAAQVLRAVEDCEASGTHFGEVSIAAGYLTEEQVAQLLEQQQQALEPLQTCLVKLGILTRLQVEDLQKAWELEPAAELERPQPTRAP